MLEAVGPVGTPRRHPQPLRFRAVGASSLDAEALREVMLRFAQALREHRDELDSLNVYPVPDGDTGTNLLTTQEAVRSALEGGPDGLAELHGEAISRAALLGARGNSGVILAQALRGLCGKLSGSRDAPTGAELAAGLSAAAEEARLAAARPVVVLRGGQAAPELLVGLE
jgi:dihydroxyacetone kinase-like predicted kinase